MQSFLIFVICDESEAKTKMPKPGKCRNCLTSTWSALLPLRLVGLVRNRCRMSIRNAPTGFAKKWQVGSAAAWVESGWNSGLIKNVALPATGLHSTQNSNRASDIGTGRQLIEIWLLTCVIIFAIFQLEISRKYGIYFRY